MDILIPNLELPLEERIQLSIYPNGLVVNHSTLDANNRRKAVALPSHGDLKDETDIIHRIEKIADDDLAQDIIGEILASPTIVEATNG